MFKSSIKPYRFNILECIRSSSILVDSSTTADGYSVRQPCGKTFVMRSCKPILDGILFLTPVIIFYSL